MASLTDCQIAITSLTIPRMSHLLGSQNLIRTLARLPLPRNSLSMASHQKSPSHARIRFSLQRPSSVVGVQWTAPVDWGGEVRGSAGVWVEEEGGMWSGVAGIDCGKSE